MLTKSLALVLLAAYAVAEIPPYIKVCGRRNPNLDKCILESVEGLRGKLREGIPELEVPPLEPLHLEGFPISNTETFRAYAYNVTLHGLTNFKVKSFHTDLKEHRVLIEVVIDKVELDADYDVNAKVVVPIAGKGPIHIESKNVQASVVMNSKLVKKNGAEYMYFPSMTTKLTIEDFKADFKSFQSEDSPITAAINTALESGRQEILDAMRPTLEKVISEKVLELANQICKHFTYDELHPDTE